MNDTRAHRTPVRRALLITASIVAVILVPITYLFYLGHVRESQRRAVVSGSLHNLANRYFDFHAKNHRSPGSMEELSGHSPAPTMGFDIDKMWDASVSLQMIEDGRFVVIWGAQLPGDGNENDRYILGYETNCRAEGGIVLCGGGSTIHVSAAEFRAMPLMPSKME